jgi:hypothetical protein
MFVFEANLINRRRELRERGILNVGDGLIVIGCKGSDRESDGLRCHDC